MPPTLKEKFDPAILALGSLLIFIVFAMSHYVIYLNGWGMLQATSQMQLIFTILTNLLTYAICGYILFSKNRNAGFQKIFIHIILIAVLGGVLSGVYQLQFSKSEPEYNQKVAEANIVLTIEAKKKQMQENPEFSNEERDKEFLEKYTEALATLRTQAKTPPSAKNYILSSLQLAFAYGLFNALLFGFVYGVVLRAREDEAVA